MKTLIRRALVFIAAVLLLVPTATFAQPPNAPQNFTALVYAGNPMVRFSWSPPFSGPAVTGYVLELGSTPGGTGSGMSLPANVTSFEMQLAYRTYYARVKAVNASGTSPASNEVRFTVTCDLPSRGARNHSWRPVGPNQVQVVWDSPDAGLTWRVGVFRAPGRTVVMETQPNPPTRRAMTLTLDPGTYYVAITGFNFCGGDAPGPEITVVSGQSAGVAAVVINELDGFVELKNRSASAVNIGAWWLMTAAGAEERRRSPPRFRSTRCSPRAARSCWGRRQPCWARAWTG